MKAQHGMNRKGSRKEGSALLPTMAIAALTVTYSSMVIAMSGQQLHSTKHQSSQVKARALAEAGANEAYASIREDWNAVNNANLFPLTAMGGGTYDATVTSVGSSTARISSLGTYRGAEEVVVVDVANAGSLNPAQTDTTEAWGHSIYVNGKITHNGSGSLDGSVHCNRNLTANGNITWDADVQCVEQFHVNGGGSILNGTVRAPVISGSGAGGIANAIQEIVEVIDFPEIDPTPYYNIALANGEVYPGGTYTVEDLGTIPGGVAWFNGDVTFTGVEFEGCIIATGDITFNGGVEQEPVGMLPAIVSRDGNIRFNGSRDIEGLVYCRGDLRFNGSGTLEGSAIVGGDLRFNGSYGVISYRYSEPGTADDTPEELAQHIGISAWQE